MDGGRNVLRPDSLLAAGVLIVTLAAGWRLVDAAVGPSALPASHRPSRQQQLPPGVTPAMVDQGEGIFRDAGLCSSCHGPDGKGLPRLGSDLTDGKWLHSDGSYEAIVRQIDTGVRAEASTSGVPMPPRAGARLTDEQVRSVAAYVWLLSRTGGASH